MLYGRPAGSPLRRTGSPLLMGTALGLILSLPLRAAEDDAPHPTYSQTIRGVTVRLTGVQWSPFDVKDPLFAYFKSFCFYYSVQAGPGAAQPPPGKSLLDCVTAVTALAPDGSELGNGGGGYSSNAAGEKITASANWENVDPRWPVVGIDVDFVDPAAPPRAVGLSVAPVTISGIPVPTQMDTVTPVHAETVTPLGTHVIVEKVKISPGATGVKTWFVFRVVPEPDAPDLQFRCTTGSKVVDDTGAAVNPPNAGGSIGNNDELGDPSGGGNRGEWTVGVGGVPAPGARTLRLTLDATESSEMLKQDTAYRHFHLRVPLGTLWAGDRSRHAALETVEGKRVEATLDALAPAWGRFRARFVLRDRADPTILWRVKAVRAQDDAGNPLMGQPSNDTFYWQVDGEPLGPGDTACEIMLGMPGSRYDPYGSKPALPAKTLALAADAEAVRFRSHVLDFSRVPVPAPGQTLTLDRRVTDAYGASLVLRKVMAYSPAHPLPADFPNPYHNLIAPAGLAVVLAKPADPHGTTFDYQLIAANDPMGRRLRPVSSLTYAQGDGLRAAPSDSPADPARVVTYLLRAPTPGTATFNLRLGRDETILLGRTETLSFPPVAAPVLPQPDKRQ